jgi:L-lactate dehydrogenase complex protein LldF
MTPTSKSFKDIHETELTKFDMRAAVLRGTSTVDARRKTACAELDTDDPSGYQALRTRAASIKDAVLADLPSYIDMFANNAEAAGATIHFASDAADARTSIQNIIRSKGAKVIVKSKSMVSEEIDLNAALELDGYRVIETDLGEFILQLEHEHPSHIVLPAVHKPKVEVERMFNKLYDSPIGASADELAQTARRVIRQDFLDAEVGISGGNFLVADTGSIVIVENEGNARLTTSLPKCHIAIVGIEKIIPSIDDLPLFLNLLSRSATGQRSTVFVSTITGPKTSEEPDGPEEMHIVLVDNRRSTILADEELRPILRCIRCAACVNTCPVYQQIGGHAYGWVYSGPIGAILDPVLLGLENAYHLPYASSLGGACTEVCPVKIPIDDILVEHRKRAVSASLTGSLEAMAMASFATVMVNHNLYEAATRLAAVMPSSNGRTSRLPLPVITDWQSSRDLPAIKGPRFRDIWKQRLAAAGANHGA